MSVMNLPVHQYHPEFYSGAKVRQSELTFEYNAITTATTLVTNTIGNVGNCHALVECTSGSFTVTLPTAVGCVGYQFVIKNTGSGTITLATTSAQTIDGASTQSISQYNALTVVSNGTNWIII